MADITRMTIELSDGRRIVAYPEGGCQVERKIRGMRDWIVETDDDAMSDAELAELLRRAAVLLADTGQRLGDVAVAEPVEIECRSCRGYGHFDGAGNPSIDKRDRKCLDCRGIGHHVEQRAAP